MPVKNGVTVHHALPTGPDYLNSLNPIIVDAIKTFAEAEIETLPLVELAFILANETGSVVYSVVGNNTELSNG